MHPNEEMTLIFLPLCCSHSSIYYFTFILFVRFPVILANVCSPMPVCVRVLRTHFHELRVGSYNTHRFSFDSCYSINE